MFHITRRSFFVGLAALILLLTHDDSCGAQQVRYDARSVEGKKMLAIYAKAVATMKTTPAGDPDSWTFQWYTHSVRADRSKAGELMAIYGAGSSPNKALAQSMWDTCQPHMPPFSENDFLPWHRMYLYYFEEIIREVSGEKCFTLPYWNYSTTDTTIHGVIPPEFTKKNDPLFQSLYVENRNTGVNAGQAIDKGMPPTTLSTDALAECFYEPTGGVHPGFCMKLDNGLHGMVHVLVGDGQNMGSVPWAARDPIFYLHHCNIDRLWASWNIGGRSNATGMGSFTFAENKKATLANVAAWMAPETEKNGYRYDRLDPVPKCPTTKATLLALVQNQRRIASVKSKEIKLGPAQTKVALEPLAVKEGVKAMAFHERIKTLPNEKRVYLLVKNLSAKMQPGVLYHLYLDLPQGVKDEKATPHFVGTVNFFDSVPHGDVHENMAKKSPERFYQFDITDLAKALEAKNLLTASPTLTISPTGQPNEKASPVIGEISIIEQ